MQYGRHLRPWFKGRIKGRRVVEGQTDGKGRLVLVQKFAIVMGGANFCEPTICE